MKKTDKSIVREEGPVPNNSMGIKRPGSMDEYLAGIPKDQRAALEHLRKVIRRAAPDAVEMIGWGMPELKINGKQLVSFAAFKEHLTLFPMSVRVMEEMAEDLSDFDRTKGGIHFNVDRPIPDKLVVKIIELRIVEIEEAAANKKMKVESGRPYRDR